MQGLPGNIPEPLRALDILESVGDAVYAFDRDWHVVYANTRAVAMARLPRRELIGTNFWYQFPETVNTPAETNLRAAMADTIPRRFEYFHAPFELWVEMDACPTPSGLVVFVRDITHRKQSDADKDTLYAALKAEQERLRLSEERFRIALKNSPVVVFNQDASLTYTWLYNPFEEYRDVDWVGRNDLDLAESGTAIIELKKSVLATGLGARREVEITHQGRPRYLDFHLEPLRGPDGGIAGLTGAVTDVTAHKRALREIELQKTLLRSVIDGMPGLVSYIDRNYTYRFVSARYKAWMGQPVEYFEGKPLGEALGPDAMAELRPHLDRAFAGETVSFERRLQCVDTVRDIRATYIPQTGALGETEGVIALIADITEQKRAEEARRESESQFRRIVELASEGIWMVDTRGCTTFVNRRMAELLSCAEDEILGRHCLDFIHSEDREKGLAGISRRIEGDSRPREYRFVRKDGSTVWLDFTAAPVRDSAGNITGLLAMCTDITERKLAQEQMQQTQKLESLGVLAGGIAHDFNNLLVGILGNASLAADLVDPSSPAQPLLSGVVAAGERAAKLTRQLLAYAGRDTRRTGPVSLDAIVSDIVPLLHASIPRTVSLQLRLAGNLPFVQGDEGQLQQIVMNLVINGAEAIPAGAAGELTISTEARHPTPEELRRAVIPLTGPDTAAIALTVTDNGSGMDAATVARIFDPFFTTKFAGRGLGLSAVLGIVKAHAGTLVIESVPGEGTSFRVFLRASAESPVSPPRADLRMSPDTGTILVVDDEPTVRMLAVQALEFSGFSVIEATDGSEAIEMVLSHPEIDAVLLDLAMPKMPGDQAAPQILNLRPGLPILLSSGCSEREARERFEGIGFNGFLQKPYTVRKLIQELRAARDRTRPPTAAS